MKFHNRHHANEGLVNFDDLNLMDDDSHKLIVYDDLFENLIADAEGFKVVKVTLIYPLGPFRFHQKRQNICNFWK